MITFHHGLYSGPLPEGVATHRASCGCQMMKHPECSRIWVVVNACSHPKHYAGLMCRPTRAPKRLHPVGSMAYEEREQ